MNYSINQVARMLGITPKTLRYYEQIGLVSPDRREDSNYRIYSDDNVEKLRSILFYRKLEFPLKDIKQLVESPDNHQDAIRAQIDKLDNESRRYKALAQMAKKTLLGYARNDYILSGGTAMIIQGMQNDFVTGSLACTNAQDIIENISALADAIRDAGMPIIYVNDMHIQGIDQELTLWGDHALVGTKGIETIPELCPKRNEKIIYKRYYGGFLKTELHKVLSEYGTTHLIITGLLTNVGISHTVSDGYYRGYRTCVPSDCTATIHQSEKDYALEQMKASFGTDIVTSEELIRQVSTKAV